METLNAKITELATRIKNAKRIVFFGGAGVSTESGLKDFRSVDGLYSEHYKLPPEYMLSHTCFVRDTEEFFRFYRDKLLVDGVQPNPAHYKLQELENSGKHVAVVTQNIDGLHTLAGSKRVYELHGSVERNFCERCGKFFGLDAVKNSTGIPRCECGGIIKPDVVLYEESLDEDVLTGAVKEISRADLMIIAGTSLAVYPAAGLINYFNGYLVVINRDATPADSVADLVIHAKVGEVLSQISL